MKPLHTLQLVVSKAGKTFSDVESFLVRLAIEPNGQKTAREYIGDLFQMGFGEELKVIEHEANSIKKQLEDASQDLVKAEEGLEHARKSYVPPADDTRESKPLVGFLIMLEVLGIAGCLGLGIYNFATLLIQYGEPFLSSPEKAYLTAIGTNVLLFLLLSVLISVQQHAATKRKLATGMAWIAIPTVLFAIIELSFLYAPTQDDASLGAASDLYSLPDLTLDGLPSMEATGSPSPPMGSAFRSDCCPSYRRGLHSGWVKYLLSEDIKSLRPPATPDNSPEVRHFQQLVEQLKSKISKLDVDLGAKFGKRTGLDGTREAAAKEAVSLVSQVQSRLKFFGQ